MMDILDKIKNGNGRQIYNLMKQIRQRNEDGDTRKDLKTYWYACFERAKELNAQKYGNWEEAMAILDSLSEPNVCFGDQNRVSIYLKPIKGYPCVYCKEKNDKAISSRIYITNPIKNTMYLVDFTPATEKQARLIFG